MTLNLDYNKALKHVRFLTDEYKPDVLCLQEINTASEHLATIESYGYRLCDYANSRVQWGNIYGVATFIFNPHIQEVKSDVISLPSGFVEIVEFLLNAGRRQKTVLKTICTVDDKRLSIVNMHLTAYSTNRLRDKQIHEVFQYLKLNSDPAVILGDFNYPYRRSKFEQIFQAYNLKEATTNIRSTFRSSIPFIPFRFKTDYVLYKGLKHVATQQVKVRYSDHMPLLSTFSL